jgi:hypothetical protein
MPGFSNLLGWRRRSGSRTNRRARRVTRKATLVPPGLTRPEQALVAGSVLFHYRRTEQEELPAQLRPLIATLLWRAARLVVMGERGAGAATRHDLDRCGAVVYRHLGLGGHGEADLEIDRQLQEFFAGPNLPFALLVERLAPQLAPGVRAQLAGLLEEMIRDLAEQFGMTRAINRE